MELLYSTQLAIPLFQVLLLLVLSTIALLFGRLRIALFTNYCFTLYWGYISNLDLFTKAGAFKFDTFTFTYFGFGLLIVFLAMIGLFLSKSD
ncbi:MAG: hypothetical protein WC560_05300 [Syntrophales bacterium]